MTKSSEFLALAQAQGGLSHPLVLTVLMLGAALLPFALLSFTSFVKLSVVFNILRNALGLQQVPSTALISLLSLVLTIQIMQPVLSRSLENAGTELYPRPSQAESAKDRAQKSWESELLIERLKLALTAAAEPIRHFLMQHSKKRERVFFSSIHQTASGGQPPLEGENFFSLVCAFLISELNQAFALGFVLFLPFLIVDLVVANVLVALGMMMVSPVTISLPLKIILFVLCDGWFLLCRALVLGYQ